MSDEVALIEALCGRGWDAPVEPDIERATELLTEHPELTQASVYAAAAAGDEVALAALLDADPEAVSRSGGPRDWEPVLYAAYSSADKLLLDGHRDGIVRTLKLLLDRGADPDAHYSAEGHDNGFSALYGTIAVSKDRVRTNVLLDAGASPSDGNSTFHAVEAFDLDLLQALARNGIEPDDASYTIKHAIDMGFEAATRFFLDQGADPDAAHPAGGETTLHWAVKRGAEPHVLQWLLDAGADPNAKTTDGRAGMLPLLGHTPLDFALRLGHTDAVRLLETAGGHPTPPTEAERFLFAVARGDGDAARAMLGADDGLLDALPDEDRGLVAFWAQHGRRAAVALACELGFPLDGTAWMGLTPLHGAALRGDVELTRTLLDAGAPQVDLGGYFGTPRHTAETCQWYAGDYAAVLAVFEAWED